MMVFSANQTGAAMNYEVKPPLTVDNEKAISISPDVDCGGKNNAS
ncbi:hypothetical protein [Collimonas silvisoli]|nr:hypothetical protein [Collimonas silvisoli]